MDSEDVQIAAPGAILGQQLAGRRIKMWDELTDPEKIERMREQVLDLQRDKRELRRLVEQLSEHSHGTRGEVLVGLNRFGMSSFGEGLRDNRYF